MRELWDGLNRGDDAVESLSIPNLSRSQCRTTSLRLKPTHLLIESVDVCLLLAKQVPVLANSPLFAHAQGIGEQCILEERFHRPGQEGSDKPLYQISVY
jgi:hypothetical protein